MQKCAPMPHFNPNSSRARNGGPKRRGRGKQRREASFAGQVIIACVMVGGVTWMAAPQLTAVWEAFSKSPEERQAAEQSAYYPNCAAAQAAGAAPIYQGQPGYREGMDGDGDGIACEPYRR